MCRRWITIVEVGLAVLLSIANAVRPSFSQEPSPLLLTGPQPSVPMEEISSVLDTDLDVERALDGVLRSIESDSAADEATWRRRIDTLIQLADLEPDAMVVVPPSPTPPLEYPPLQNATSLQRRISQILQTFPPIAQELLWRRFGIVTRNEILTLVESNIDDSIREQRLLELAQRIPNDDASILAFNVAGELAWRRADTIAARRAWSDAFASVQSLSKISDTSNIPSAHPSASTDEDSSDPSSTVPRAAQEVELAFRLILLSLQEYDLQRAEREIAVFESKYPEAIGTFGGIERNYGTQLRTLLAQRTPEPAEPLIPAPTFQIRPLVSFSPSISSLYPFHTKTYERMLTPSEDPFDPFVVHQSRFPVVAPDSQGNEILWWADATTISGVRIADGTPVYENAERSPVFFRDVLFSAQPISQNANPPTNLDVLAGIPFVTLPDSQPPPLGTPIQWVQIVGDRLVAKLGSPLTSLPPTTDHRLNSDIPLDETTESEIVVLDLATDGQLLQRIRSSDLSTTFDSTSTNLSFDGPPTIDSERLYLTLRQRQQGIAVTLVALELDSGTLLWRRTLSHGTTPALDDSPEITTICAAVDSTNSNRSTLYICSGLGSVAALDRSTGRPFWLATYPRDPLPEIGQRLVRHTERTGPSILPLAGFLVVAPPDSERIYLWDAATGRPIGVTPPLPDVQYLIGGGTGRLSGLLWVGGERYYQIATGGTDVGRIERSLPESTETLHSNGRTFVPICGPCTGRGALVQFAQTEELWIPVAWYAEPDTPIEKTNLPTAEPDTSMEKSDTPDSLVERRPTILRYDAVTGERRGLIDWPNGFAPGGIFQATPHSVIVCTPNGYHVIEIDSAAK